MKCCIYKIWSDECDEVYIGSTSNFKLRMNDHKSKCNNENSDRHNLFIYQFIRQNGGWDNFKSSVIWEGEVKDKYEKLKIEGEYIKQYEKILNSNNSYGIEDHKERCKKYRNEYKDIIKEKNKQYCEANKDKKKEKDKKYYEANKDKIKQKNKEYAKKRVQCPHCNKEMNKSSLLIHIKTQHI